MKVTLNKDSWHFKIYNKVIGGNPPKTLCSYIWSLVNIFVMSPLLLLIVLFLQLILVGVVNSNILIPSLVFVVFSVLFIDRYGDKIFRVLGRFFSYLNLLKCKITKIIGGMVYLMFKNACPIITWKYNEIENKE